MTGLPQDVVADLRQENARLLAELRAARDRQAGSAEILSTIASAPGDAERALQQVAETTARLFGPTEDHRECIRYVVQRALQVSHIGALGFVRVVGILHYPSG